MHPRLEQLLQQWRQSPKSLSFDELRELRSLLELEPATVRKPKAKPKPQPKISPEELKEVIDAIRARLSAD